MIVNNSLGKPNWTQLKNSIEPLSTCNVTACINASQAAGYDIEKYNKKLALRPSDDLLLFIRSNKQCNDLWYSLDKTKSIPINQWMAVLALGLSLYLDASNIFFKMSDSKEMFKCIINDGACVISGRYKTKQTFIDHISAIVGIEYHDNGIDNFIIDDSYGDYRTEYKSKNGDNIIMPYLDFISFVKEQYRDVKRCIFVPKKE